MLEAHELLGAVAGTREINRRKLIIEIMIKADIQSRIAYRMGVSAASVSTAVQELVEAGIVDGERGEAERGKGRGKVRLRPVRGLAVGIDVGFRRTTVIIRRVDARPDEIVVRRRADGAEQGLGRIVPIIWEMINEAATETSLRVDDVVSAGMAVPRMIDPRTGWLTTPVLPPWSLDDRPAAGLSDLLGLHVALDNDANLGALAEQIYGLEEPIETVVYVKASTGIGAGIVIGDKLHRGDRGVAGEIGHLTVDRDGAICLCGGRGCLDATAGAEALLSQVRRAFRHGSDDVPRSLTSVIERAREGDAVCARVLADAGRALGFALAQLVNLINPRLIVLGGELSSADELVLTPCEHELRRYGLAAAVSGAEGFTLRRSRLDALAEAYGALILGLRWRQSHPAGALPSH
ncbi:Sugar kinase of the NBD/HSP70 family, may contain an N-terminal HTH domain [Amycolatopsis xylanica]|uniref:Sugar kinase of the NBD/HSP70 family, may contain an N-terminal HTH domain n=1 Tax=Amycolatopsis xylanica TaxID=589385 RepID=A0A1H3EMD3_9PSEU|nr:ROK family protein [Amycolatopsis xylanica]SDX79902.1 Sugar kinase of the NBD/HSP70 family, may contain an N-terminal HTH domain [Amycolatopsis xylanica]